MYRALHLVAAVALLTSLGCSASEADFCKKLREFDPDGQKDCETDAVQDVKRNCSNPGAIFSCVARSGDKNAADACEKLCEKK